MKEVEIEKRYLMSALNLEQISGAIIKGSMSILTDFYVPNGDRHTDLRLRRQDDNYMITRKQPVSEDDMSVMIETTITLSPEEFTALSSGIENQVQKERFAINWQGHQGSLDVFGGKHRGLVLVEFEFENSAQLTKFQTEVANFAHTHQDDFYFTDITDVEALSGGHLAGISLEELELELSKLGIKTAFK